MFHQQFKVPEGFVITTESFRKQLRSKSHLQDSIRELEDVSRGKIVGDLETFCKKYVIKYYHKRNGIDLKIIVGQSN